MLRRAIPELYADLDLTREPVALEKELPNISIKSAGGSLYPDLLVKIFLKDGLEEYLLLHVEVQGLGGAELSERMYRYKSSIYLHHDVEPIALAILTESARTNEPESYAYSAYGTAVNYSYNRLVVPHLNPEELKLSDNPFDLALLAAYRAHETLRYSETNEKLRFNYLKELLKVLSERGWDYRDTRRFMAFLEAVLSLKTPQLMNEIAEYERDLEWRDKTMLMTYIEKQNWNEGMAVGMEKGQAVGMAKVARNLISMGVDKKTVIAASGLTEQEIEELAKE